MKRNWWRRLPHESSRNKSPPNRTIMTLFFIISMPGSWKTATRGRAPKGDGLWYRAVYQSGATVPGCGLPGVGVQGPPVASRGRQRNSLLHDTRRSRGPLRTPRHPCVPVSAVSPFRTILIHLCVFSIMQELHFQFVLFWASMLFIGNGRVMSTVACIQSDKFPW